MTDTLSRDEVEALCERLFHFAANDTLNLETQANWRRKINTLRDMALRSLDAVAVREATIQECARVCEDAAKDYHSIGVRVCNSNALAILAIDRSKIKAAPQLPHGVCRADDPNEEAEKLDAGSSASAHKAVAPTAEPKARGVAPSVSDDRAGTSITAGAAPDVRELVKRLLVLADAADREGISGCVIDESTAYALREAAALFAVLARGEQVSEEGDSNAT